ncbi:cytochrome o ubiquinol oxidase subunit I [Photobacterium carnosum]|uniref:Cytochrome bo(3) ubiquinol oxidase subunit 1 n=1 Tax=Photobacterium carnosum TaxID=2023717 RepID=A0A2N4URB4_9GAMM|nr:cytochrome o ubiquinol oxidase subunit I [Photobacterium carnosum]PLC57553.1 cytochrome o ubiquinol oxidase subunit I [Photobacterium carnosum]
MAYKGNVYAEVDPVFGKLNWDVIPFTDPVVFPVMMAVVLGGLGLLGLITYQRKWHYLWSEWFTSVDHKKIGIMYIIVSMVMLVRGFSDAILMRSQQAASTIDASYLPPEHYDQVFTAHGVIMIFFVAMPFVVGLMNIIVPLQIGARDVAFPFLNSLSFWLFVVGVILINMSLFVGEFAATGWLAYPPLSGMDANPWVGVDYWLWSLQISGIGTLLTGINFVVTILRMRAPGMKMMQMPVFTWTSLCANALIVLAFPILTVTLTLLTLDRYVGTHFFTTDMGGNQMMYVNLIWAWGHPEVYILVLPAFGIFSEITATFSRKRLFGYTSLVWATMVIMVLSFIVWLHHFFTMGAGASVNAFFGIATMIISIPTGVKIFNWLFTMYKGRVEFSASMWWTIAFLITFTIGGMTGVMLAIPAANFVLHNSLFVIAHFHNVIIGGALFGYFAGLTYWFPKATGFTLDERLGKLSCALWTVGFFVAFMPVYVLGFNGMTRRLNVAENPEWAPYLWVAAFGVCIVAAGIAVQFYQIFVSIRDRKQNLDLTGDPWNGRTLEWATSSPPPFYNFALLPKIHDRDEHHYAKEHGLAYQEPEPYKRIHMPKNTWAGVVISMFSLMFGFAFIWHIWWMVIAGAVGMIASWIGYSFQRSKDYYVEVSEIEAIERKHLAKARGEKTAEHKDGEDDNFDPSDLKPADSMA